MLWYFHFAMINKSLILIRIVCALAHRYHHEWQPFTYSKKRKLSFKFKRNQILGGNRIKITNMKEKQTRRERKREFAKERHTHTQNTDFLSDESLHHCETELRKKKQIHSRNSFQILISQEKSWNSFVCARSSL